MYCAFACPGLRILIHENDVHSLVLASKESMVESIRNIHAEDKIFSIVI
ncbi:hypothetical protein AC15_1335 [Escherichia coli 2-156-04_S3_C2]|nr:hypothetical protein AC15_1335 [Escherichia coli 2-156-04_S3_C2]